MGTFGAADAEAGSWFCDTPTTLLEIHNLTFQLELHDTITMASDSGSCFLAFTGVLTGVVTGGLAVVLGSS